MSRLRLFIGIVVVMALMAPATSVSAGRVAYNGVTETLGGKGYTPTHPNGWYRGQSAPPWYYETRFTSYCASPANGYHYGVLTHPRGYEITEQGYGDTAYTMYDGASGWIRAANVRESDGKLVSPGRIDTCRAPGAPDQEPPPPPPPPPSGLAGGDDSIVGTYRCNILNPNEGSSHVHLSEDGTFTVMPARAETFSADPVQGTQPRQGTWWSYPGDPHDRGQGVSLRDGVFIHFQGNTSLFTIEGDHLVVSGFDCERRIPHK